MICYRLLRDKLTVRIRVFEACIFLLALMSTGFNTLYAEESKSIDFSREVQPILSAACFHCHGPDEETREADLRLDNQEGLLADLGDYAAVVPGKPESSELYRRITSGDPDTRMPSEESLSDEEIAVIKTWIEQGATWSEHWAFVPPKRPELPADSKDSDWARSPIDAFVSSKLKSESLEPSAEADRTTLLRRLSLDLIGLPPTIEEIEAFNDDTRPDAYQRQVERLLASPHYGEHWGRQWLDAARYADSDGFEKDLPRDVWFYRDWVIQSLNADMPYDQFVVEQIAGDLLTDATQSQRVATGFLRNSMVNEEGGIDPEQFRMEAMFDRMDAIGTSVLGLTVRCSQCHSHKFDPLTQKAYYQMFAFLNNFHESQIAVYTPEQAQRREQIIEEIRNIEKELQQKNPDWQQRMTAWEQAVLAEPQPDWHTVELEFDDSAAGGQKFYLQPDGSYLGSGYAPINSGLRVYVKTELPEVASVRVEYLLDPNLPFGGPGRAIDGTFALTEFEAQTASPKDDFQKRTKVEIADATADISLPEAPISKVFEKPEKDTRVTGPIEMAIDGDGNTAWGINAGPGRRNQPRKTVYNFSDVVKLSDDVHLSLVFSQRHGGTNGNERQANIMGRFRVSVTSAPEATADPLPSDVREIIEQGQANRTKKQNERVFSYWRTTIDEWQEANDRIEQLWQQHPEPSSQLAVIERDTPRNTHLLGRGDFLSLQEKVEPNVPEFLHNLPAGDPNSRLTFARWLVDPQSPTTARAIVNRVWQAYFGTGLVRTSSDLGTQSDAPSHPQLFDWLAVELMESGWSLKHLHRQIVSSATYRQSSDLSPELRSRDPENRLLGRGPRFRVQAETIRDIALAASGLINRKIGGPSVYPPSPEVLYKPPISYGTKTWKHREGEDNFRRALYTFKFRSVPFPALETFDAPKGESACVRRSRSNTPLQALTMLNEPLMMQCARALAQKTINEGGETDQQRIAFAFRQCVARVPTAKETEVLLAMLERNEDLFSQQEETVSWQLAADNPEQPPELPSEVTPARAASWTAVSRILLNLDETISKE